MDKGLKTNYNKKKQVNYTNNKVNISLIKTNLKSNHL